MSTEKVLEKKESVSFNLRQLVLDNSFYRKVLYTTQQMQVVAMSIDPRRSIHPEVHNYITQMFTVIAGSATISVNDVEHIVGEGDSVLVPAGAKHEVYNNSEIRTLKLWTVYAPPQHEPGTVDAEEKD
jgi:mannose-6-phosphate isomerase-like protein (cupin superfamily)